MPVTDPELVSANADASQPAGDGWIRAPRTAEDTGLTVAFLEELAIKAMARERELTTWALAEILCVTAPVVDEIFQRLRKAQLVEVTGLVGTMFRAVLTAAGRARANELLAASQYVGAAPVPLAVYAAQARAQSVAEARVRPDGVRRALGTLVLDDDVVRQIGIAIASGSPLMLFGPSGTGKTAIAERIPNAFDDGVFIPHAIEVGGDVITLFDPGVHRPVDVPLPPHHDRRWVYCDRPIVVVGGELTPEMLDLQHNPTSGYYAAPPQLKANAGVLVIDDFGRQRMRPEELLNRWIAPLERGTDVLTLHGGGKVAVPFAMLIVFATNLDPTSAAVDAGTTLSDAVFLRRIPSKVRVGFASVERFHEIFRRSCDGAGLAYDRAVVTRLITLLTEEINEPLRPSVARDLVRRIVWEARYDGVAAVLNASTMARACRGHFALLSLTPPAKAGGAAPAA